MPKHASNLLIAAYLLGVIGCSTLGFSTTPVAHIMTDDTKRVLEQTPRPSNVARELAKEVQPEYHLQPGDEVLVEVVDSQSNVQLPADQTLMADGTVDLGRYGRVVVAGKTLEQSEAAIQQMIYNTVNDSVAINLRLIGPVHRYYVIGEVNSPGAYSLTGYETVLDAIMEAGGLTDRASACDLLLARPTNPNSCRVTLPVCYRAITQLGDTTTNYHLQPGDRIFVAKQSCCEEIMAFCSAGRTCERCCNKQTACCVARNTQSARPKYVPSASEEIYPVAKTQQTADLKLDLPARVPQPIGQSDSLMEANDLDFDPLRRPIPLPIPKPKQSTNGVQQQEPARERLDGELDFGMLLRGE